MINYKSTLPLLAFILLLLIGYLKVLELIILQGKYQLLIVAVPLTVVLYWLLFLEFWRKAFRFTKFDSEDIHLKSFVQNIQVKKSDISYTKTRYLKSRFGAFGETTLVVKNGSTIKLSEFYLKNYKKYVGYWQSAGE